MHGNHKVHRQRMPKNLKRREHMETEKNQASEEAGNEEPRILEEIQVEELAIDGICGVY